LILHLKRRRLYARRPSAALAIRKIASALNLHLKGRRLAQGAAVAGRPLAFENSGPGQSIQ
jgi:hypothetical protein